MKYLNYNKSLVVLWILIILFLSIMTHLILIKVSWNRKKLEIQKLIDKQMLEDEYYKNTFRKHIINEARRVSLENQVLRGE